MSIENLKQQQKLIDCLNTSTVETASHLNQLLDEIETNDRVPQNVKDMAIALQKSRDRQLVIVNELQALQAIAISSTQTHV